MKNRCLLLAFMFVTSTFVAITSCKKEKVDDSDNGFPIELMVEQSGRNIKLEWTETKISNFERYILVRSGNPILDAPTPPPGAIANIDDYKTTSFEDASFPLTEFVYYKVYVKFGDRFLYSPTVKLATKVNLLNLSANRVTFNKSLHLVYLFDSNKNRVYKYDYQSEKIVDSLIIPSVFDLRMAVGNNGNGNELYIAKNNPYVVDVYNADDLTLKTSFNVNNYVHSITSGNNDFLYLTTDDWSSSFKVYKRSTKQLKDSASSINGGNEAIINVLTDDGLEVVSSSFNVIEKYTINSQGAIINQCVSQVSGSFFGNPQHLAVAADGKFFIASLIGDVINDKCESAGLLSSNGGTAFNDFVFSANNDKIWALRSFPSGVDEFSFPSISMQKSIELNYAPIFTELEGDELIIIGNVQDAFGFNKTLVDKLKIN